MKADEPQSTSPNHAPRLPAGIVCKYCHNPIDNPDDAVKLQVPPLSIPSPESYVLMHARCADSCDLGKGPRLPLA